MRTTVDIPDAIYRRLKTRAAAEDTSVKALILHGVEQTLKGGRPKAGRTIRLPIVESKRPGKVRLDNAKMNLRSMAGRRSR